ncbi:MULTISPECIES: fimbrial chaperone [unclassified Photobacterium]|uniref:fimbrial chaperone n=1 Tax=unclassified Photobacterium TaxID=2628852 RepID=UPI001EDD8AB1|nr:fimbrial chaperone [Photobacterium sp. Ph6]MCG3874516.1 fimbrial chaperone [Photobacterium sp. Ph5]
MHNRNKLAIQIIIFFIGLYTAACHASFVLNGTRFIYSGDQKNISFQITNHSKGTYGGQVWIENSDIKDHNIYFIPAPSFFSLLPSQVQIDRIIKVNNNLPKNKESLFYLNVQEIPKLPKNNGNELQIAMDIRVKLIYRPISISSGRNNAEQQVEIKYKNGRFLIENPTPYYFAITQLIINNQTIHLSKITTENLCVFKPYSTVLLPNSISHIHSVSFKAINDYGENVSYKISKA